jgi:hypothetical protein
LTSSVALLCPSGNGASHQRELPHVRRGSRADASRLCARFGFANRSSPPVARKNSIGRLREGHPFFAGAIAAGAGKWLPCQQNDDDVSTLELLLFEHLRRKTQGACGGLGRVHRRQASSRPGVRNICAFRRLCLVLSSKAFHRLFRPLGRSKRHRVMVDEQRRESTHASQPPERRSQSLQLCDPKRRYVANRNKRLSCYFKEPRARYRGRPSRRDAVERQARRILEPPEIDS